MWAMERSNNSGCDEIRGLPQAEHRRAGAISDRQSRQRAGMAVR
ncbi:hypothetical protein PM01_08840 [Sulfitobacter pontiacus 3SOLIMAR09]|nr:hypothetical protein PM01_08840 [Sulfitobacter pontiacus 3SOLIMAR09]